MENLVAHRQDEVFIASRDDFKQGLRANPIAFWRGLVVGFLAAFPIAQLAVAGEMLPLIRL